MKLKVHHESEHARFIARIKNRPIPEVPELHRDLSRVRLFDGEKFHEFSANQLLRAGWRRG